MGIHIGDVVVRGGDLFGDGVNLTARLEGLAEPGGICLSASAYEQVQGKVNCEFADLGEHNLKNISRPVRAYAVGLKANAHRVTSPPSSAPRLSIVVLPFANIGADPEQGYFVDGVTESLTTDLSRISGAFVIARNTAFTFKGKAIDVKKLGRELNVCYVLEGSVQRSGNRLRVNVQLIDAETGNHLWAERFDKPVTDLFDLQDEIVSRIANTLDAQLVSAEARRAEGSLHPDAMELYFQGRAWFNRGVTTEHMMKARGFFERALNLDPENIETLVGIALVDATMGAASLSDNRAARLAEAEAVVTKALSMAPQHAQAHAVWGLIQISTHRAAQGIAECEEALALDRNLATAHAWIGLAKCYLGRPAETEGHVREALRLSPRDIFALRWMMFVGYAKLMLNADEEATMWLRRSIETNRNYPLPHFLLASALALLGHLDQAKAAVRGGLAVDPQFTIHRYRTNLSSNDPTFLAGRDRIYEGMRIAGVPEGAGLGTIA
jgi:TolB-like protein/Tfp pilus assembly protein PilF